MQRKYKILISIGCLIAAGAIAVVNSSGRKSDKGIDHYKGQRVWVKCKNCGAEYQMNKAEHYSLIEEKQTGMSIPPLTCKECGKDAIYKAVKCKKCEKVFFGGAVPNDYTDRCPDCGYSCIEQGRKTAD